MQIILLQQENRFDTSFFINVILFILHAHMIVVALYFDVAIRTN